MKSLTWTRKKKLLQFQYFSQQMFGICLHLHFLFLKATIGPGWSPELQQIQYPQISPEMFFSVPISWCIFFDWEMVNRRLKTGCTGYGARQQQLMSCNPITPMSFGKGLPCKIRSWSAAIWMWIWPDPWDWLWPSCMEFIWIHGLWSSHHHERSLKFKNHRMSPLGRWTL